MTDRRHFLAGVAAAAASRPLRAQAPLKAWRIGFLGANTPDAASHLTAAFLTRLRELGLAEGRDFQIEYRWAAGDTNKYRQFASELVAARVDVIVTSGTAATVAAHSATTTIPIVMAASGDLPIGIVASYAHPGGNVTGLSLVPEESAGKRLELIKEAVAQLRTVGVLANPDANPREVSVVVSTAPTLGLVARAFEFRSVDDVSRTSRIRSSISRSLFSMSRRKLWRSASSSALTGRPTHTRAISARERIWTVGARITGHLRDRKLRPHPETRASAKLV